MTLKDWSNYIQSIHHSEIELGLNRVLEVAKRLKLSEPQSLVITVGGTNGKGSTVAGLSTIYQQAGYRVGTFTSPYLYRLNEIVKINGVEASDEAFCTAFERIEALRGEISLTPFEFNTLAALDIFQSQMLDVIVLEVGLGGRLDAVNIINSHLSILTSIGIDHVDRLGGTRELIGYEKVAIARPGCPMICGDIDPPQSIVQFVNDLNTPFYCGGKEFSYEITGNEWSFRGLEFSYDHLPLPQLALQNMATVLMAIQLLQEKLPVDIKAIKAGLKTVKLPGRLEVIPGDILEIRDVSHNPAAATWLANLLRELPSTGKTRAVFSMLGDKDMVETIKVMRDVVNVWYIAELPTNRGTPIGVMLKAFTEASVEGVQCYDTIPEAYKQALKDSSPIDRVIIFGSFYTVGSI